MTDFLAIMGILAAIIAIIGIYFQGWVEALRDGE